MTKSFILENKLTGNISNIINKWNEIGLLEGLYKKRKEKCALYFEKAINLCLKVNNLDLLVRNNFIEVETLLFPIIRRIITDIKLNQNFKIYNLYKYIINNYEKEIEKMKMSDKYQYTTFDDNDIDYEVNCCAILTENFIKENKLIRLKNK